MSTGSVRPAIAGLLIVAEARALCAFGGDSSSATTTENVDRRVVGGDASVNVSAGNSSPISITTTDHAAVDGGLKLALAGVEGAHQLATQALANNGGILEGALRQAGQQQQAFADTLERVKTSDVRVLVVAGLAVVGIAGAFALKKG